MPTDQQIEAAAMAIREVFADRVGKGRDWNALPPALKDQYRREAAAALIAASALSGR